MIYHSNVNEVKLLISRKAGNIIMPDAGIDERGFFDIYVKMLFHKFLRRIFK